MRIKFNTDDIYNSNEYSITIKKIYSGTFNSEHLQHIVQNKMISYLNYNS